MGLFKIFLPKLILIQRASALGHYELLGLLPGLYDLYAYANGYQTTLFASGVVVHEGQNLSFDAYVDPCTSNGCSSTPSNSTAETTTISLSNSTQQPVLALVVIAAAALAALILYSRRKEQPNVTKAKKKIDSKKKSFLSFSDFKAIWLVIVALGALFTLVQFIYSFIQLYTPLLSYNVTRETSSVALLKTTMILPYILTIRNDGFRDSNEVIVAVSTDSNLTYQYRFNYSSVFYWADYSNVSACDQNGPEGSRCFYAGSGFFILIPRVPALTDFSFAFNATMFYPTIVFIPVHIPSNASVVSGSVQVPEYSPLYQAQVTRTQYLFCAYSVILAGAFIVGLPLAIRNQRRATLGSLS